MFSGLNGIIHFSASIVALITGTIILYQLKGTKIHKKVGYLYCAAMLVVLISSFLQYRLHGSFSFLHWLAVISSISLLGGMVPILLKKPKNYLAYHFSFMYWSVIGLYCALVAETFVRLPFLFDFEKNTISLFYILIILATAITGGIGSFFFRKYKRKWEAQFPPD